MGEKIPLMRVLSSYNLVMDDLVAEVNAKIWSHLSMWLISPLLLNLVGQRIRTHEP